MAGDKLRIICGPTAAGKSMLALYLAERYGAAIVSADSLQIYCYFDIGTAKSVTGGMRARDALWSQRCRPEERYSAARWAAEADEYRERQRDRQEPVMRRCTGLYIKALVEPRSPHPSLTPREEASSSESWRRNRSLT